MYDRRIIPGIGLLVFGAIVARGIGQLIGIHELLVAIALGVVFANGIGIASWLDPGIATHKLWLAAGIVLMGASVTFDTMLEAGKVLLLVVVLVTGFTMILIEFLSRNVFGLGDRLGSLLAAGAGICGVSAIVAVGGAVRARETEIGYAAATILLFDAITIVVYPIIGNLLDLSGMVFGIWAGVSMFSTGPVVAVGFAHSDSAGQWATIIKLTRNALIGLIVLMYASYYAHSADQRTSPMRTIWEEFPKFVLGFLALVILASVGVFSSAQSNIINQVYHWLFLLAFVGLGTEIQLAELRNTGLKPAFVVLLSLIFASTFTLAALTMLF